MQMFDDKPESPHEESLPQSGESQEAAVTNEEEIKANSTDQTSEVPEPQIPDETVSRVEQAIKIDTPENARRRQGRRRRRNSSQRADRRQRSDARTAKSIKVSTHCWRTCNYYYFSFDLYRCLFLPI